MTFPKLPVPFLGCIVCTLCLVTALVAQDRIRFSDAEAKKAIINRVEPAYPPMARQMKISGQVVVDVDVDLDGKVEKVDVVNGNPLLSSACVAALKQWKFTPFTQGGKPAPAVLRLSFTFSM